jgi:hypothetical protein
MADGRLRVTPASDSIDAMIKVEAIGNVFFAESRSFKINP